MKKILFLLLFTTGLFAQKAYYPDISALSEQTVSTGAVTTITNPVTWTNDKVWVMDKKVVVENGGVLTIEPGTVVKAKSNSTAADATALVIAKGGKIIANGTPTAPIIFTNYDDPLTGQQPLTTRGEWGGLVILGNGIVGENGGSDDIEGIVTGASWTQYGGNVANDSSGSLKYVSIRHGGTTLTDGSEINGLTCGGVGSGTTIENIEIISNNDDGLELFGGNVNVTNLLVYNQIDDAVDIDEAYAGTVENVLVALGADSDNIFEFDGTEDDSSNPVTGAFTVQNVTAIGQNIEDLKVGNSSTAEKLGQLADLKSNATGTISDVVLKDFSTTAYFEGIDQSTFDDGELILQNWTLVEESGTYSLDNVFGGAVKYKKDSNGVRHPDNGVETDGGDHVLGNERDFFTFVSTQAANTGANTAVFNGWTVYAGEVNDLSDDYASSSTWYQPSISALPEQTVSTGAVTTITNPVTWTNDKVWVMDKKVVVENGGVLTIEPGTVVKAKSNSTAADATALVIAKGGKIIANGTPTAPIIFTNYDDPLTGQQPLTTRGEWGGLVILGNGIVGENGGSDDIEGIVTGASWTQYGGNVANDSSGSLKYVSIRHGGTTLTDGSEINGLTCGGVGSGTTIENIEIISNNDDGLELFGGNVNVTNLLVYNQIDDAVDIDEAYAGTVENVLVALGADSDNIFEFDGTEDDSSNPVTGAFTVQNVTAIGQNIEDLKVGNSSTAEKLGQLADLKSNATGTISDVVLKDFSTTAYFEGIDQSTFDDGELILQNWTLVEESGTYSLDNVFGGAVKYKKDSNGVRHPDNGVETDGGDHVLGNERDFFTFVSTQAANTGANTAVFNGWTAALGTGAVTLSTGDILIETAVKNEFTIYPNPVIDIINVQSSNESDIDGISIFNINGSRVKHVNDSKSVDMRDLSSGIYLINIKSKDQVITKKVIKL